MVAYIRSDLDFILAQIKIAEAHAAGLPLYGPGGLIPTYNLAWGLRTVDGSNNHLLPGQEQWGAAGHQFPELLTPAYRPADGTLFDPDGPAGPAPAMSTALNYNPSNNPNSLVFDSSLRTISNLLVDQTLGNPSAILTALQRAGSETQMADLTAITAIYQTFKPASDAEYQARVVMQNAKTAANVLDDGDPLTPPSPAEAAAIAALEAATEAHDITVTALEAARVVRDAALEAFGVAMDGDNVHLPAIAPDEGLSAPFNSWFTLFGQFFDHGLDLVNKGGSGTVFIPLAADDPLYVPGSHTNFMVLTRATVTAGADNVMGTADDVRPVNTTTAYVDQNQTYTSHSSHQVFVREYELNAAGRPVATGKLIEGENGGMATWGELKTYARMLGINLTDSDVGKVPLLRTDAYGNFIPNADGYAQVITGIGADGIPNTADDIVISGTPAAPVSLATAIRTDSAFLADIAHDAVPNGLADGDIEIGLANPGNNPLVYDNELLDAHFIAGDGRVNENIGLTAVHHVFHAEHNRLVDHTKEVALADAQAILDGGGSEAEAVEFLNQWLIDDVATVPITPADIAALVWDGERIFQAAKFGTEMQYQHLVFEEFARKIQPNINVFLVPDGFDTTMNPSIVAEFAHVVYRFGHSMLTESIDRYDSGFAPDHIGLIEGFLNPTAFNGVAGSIADGIAAGDIIRGMTRQVGNEIDEFVTTALRNNLLGLPLDLATINLARGRDTGVPSLNAARRDFYEATNEDSLLKPYESWVDFAGNLKHEASIINFIAAYGTHTLITGQATIEGKRDAALTIITGASVGGLGVPGDAVDFLNSSGAWANLAGGVTTTGLDNVDLWIGGLAERIMPFGGMLGSTFNFVFEVQMEQLQSGDRFYYLQRLDGLHLFGEMENNSFAAMIMRNTNATHLPSDVFSTPGLILEVDQTRQFNDLNGDGTLEITDPVGSGILTPLVSRNNPGTAGPDTNYLRYTGGDHVVLGGTDGNDILIAGIGDDTLFGDDGNDLLEGGFGNDIINAGGGDDIIKDMGGDDNIKAGAGNDVVHAGPGLDLVMGNDGQDFIFLGTDMGSEVFAGTGNDFIYGNRNAERILGNEGNDWIETGTFDGAPGDNFDEIFAHDGIDGHDVFLGDGGFDEFIGEGGDDIMVGSANRGKMVGMSGFDWATYKDNTFGVNANLSIPIIFDEAPTLPQNAALDEYESMEGLSGTRFNDVLTGTEDVAADRAPLLAGGTTGYLGSVLDQEGIDLIAGLQEVVGLGVTSFDGGDIILGGDGSDTITGNAGDDIIDGDKWLDVQIGVFAANDPDHTGVPIELHNSMTTLAARMFSGEINPGRLSIVRTIRDSNDQIADIDRAVFSGNLDEYVTTFNQDGTITVAHTGGLATDGTDTIRNVEVLQFADQAITLQPPTLDLHGPVTTTTTTSAPNAYRDEFETPAFNNSNGTVAWAATPWEETADSGGVTAGQIQIDAGGTTNELRFLGGAASDGASIARTVNLSGVTAATLSFDYDRLNGLENLDAGETVQLQYSPTGSFAAGSFVTLQTINSTSGNFLTGAGSSSFNLNLTGAGATSAIRFVSSAINGVNERVTINNLNIATTTTTTTTLPGTPGNNYATTFNENGAAVAVAAGALITDDGGTIASARVVLTNASAGDVLSVQGALPAGITSAVDNSVAGQITLTLTGNATPANYQTYLQQVRYSNTSENPSATARTLQVTVNDGLLDSAVATTTVTVVPQPDSPTPGADTILTNLAAGANISVAHALLLANDTDPEGQTVSISAAGGGTGLTSGPTNVAGVITVVDNATAGGTFTYTASDGTGTAPATVTLNRVIGPIAGGANSEIIIGDANGTTINGGGGNDNVNAGGGNDLISGGLGDDVIVGGTGNDDITWNANATGGDTDGFDIIDGGAGTTDTFILNGRADTAETFRIYARAAAEAVFIPVQRLDTEIVITRTVGLTTTVIAELNDIEEIRVSALQVTSPGGVPPGGTGGTAPDVIQVIGNFNAPFTSLNFNTITIDGNAGDDTIDISSLDSAHRIVFRSNGGNDTIVGTLRPQDVIELLDGETIDDYVQTVANGVTTLTNGNHSISYVASGEGPQIGGDVVDETTSTTPGSVKNGTSQADVLMGTAGDDNIVAFAGDDIAMGEAGADAISAGEGGDFVSGGNGRDVIFAGAGDDHVFAGADDDMVYGDAGADRIFGDQGNDLINAGAGDDTVFGGAGNDLIVAESGDGNDVYFGDEGGGGTGIDTLDMSAATANVTVNLGSGSLSNGTASSSQTGSDTIWGIENVNTGSGNDTITASNAVNVMNGGAGNDTYRFTSASAADGDTILNFEPGDRVDLSAIDTNLGAVGDQSFTLITGDLNGTAGQVAVSFDDGFTVIRGDLDGDKTAEFTIEIAGTHSMTTSNLGL